MSSIVIGLIALVLVVTVVIIGISVYLMMQESEPTPESIPIPTESPTQTQHTPTSKPTTQPPVLTKPVSIDTRPKVKYVRVVKKNKGRTYPTATDKAWGGLKTRGSIQLAEVVVWSDGVNVAPKGKARQSSTCFKGVAKFAIDGNKSGKYGWDKGSVIHTCATKDWEWWEVELDKEYSVEYVEIYNRTDCCWKRLDGAVVMLFDKIERP